MLLRVNKSNTKPVGNYLPDLPGGDSEEAFQGATWALPKTREDFEL